MMKLSKLSMPMKKKPMDPNMDSSMEEGSPEEEASESPEEEGREQDMGMDASKALEGVSDDDLMAELKKRGLMDSMDNASASQDDQEAYS